MLSSPTSVQSDDVFDISAIARKRTQNTSVDTQSIHSPLQSEKDETAIITRHFGNKPLGPHSLESNLTVAVKADSREGEASICPKLESILYPAEDVVDGRSSSRPLEFRYQLDSLQLGDLILGRDQCSDMKLMLCDKQKRLEVVVCGYKRLHEKCVGFDRSIVERVVMFSCTGSNLAFDLFCSKVPEALVILDFTKPIESPIIRMVLSSRHNYSLECMLNNLFDRFELAQSLTEYKESFKDRLPWGAPNYDFLYRRMSPRLTNRSWQARDDETETVATMSFAKRRRASFVSSSQVKEPVIPEKAIPLFVYPETGKYAVTITTADTSRLEPQVFLNDSIIDFDLRYMHENLEKDVRDRIYVYSSFFFKRLSDEGHSGVGKWTDEVNVFAKDFLIIPVCEHLHWYLVVICYPYRAFSGHQRQLSSSDDRPTKQDGTEDSQVCYLLVMDSLGRSRPGALSKLKGYLVEEAKDKLKIDISKESIIGIMVKCPQQDNYSDCGLFCCQNVECFLKEPDQVVYKAKHNELVNWFPSQLAHDRRQRLKGLVATLASTSSYQIPSEPTHSSDIEEIIILE